MQSQKNMDMDQLPNEMLAYIFDYLNRKEILSMLLVCKRFNELISSDSTLMGKIKLVFDFNKIQESSFTRSAKKAKLKDPHELYLSNRNYQKIKILNTKKLPDESRMQIFKQFQNIKKISLKNCDFRESALCLRPLLDIWNTHLTKIKIEEVYCEAGDENSEPLEFDRLRELTVWNASSEFLRNFTKSKLNKLNVCSASSDSQSDDDVINFLNLQSNLKHLKLLLMEDSTIFFKSDLSSVKFELDSMAISTKQSNQEIERINYHKFLRSQGKSLIELIHVGYLTENICCIILSKMPNLKIFRIVSYCEKENEFTTFDSLPVNNSIESCKIRLASPSDPVQSVLKLMKNLQKLELTNTDLKFLFEVDLKFLNHLILYYCTVEESELNEGTGAFESLKRLELDEVSWELARHLILKNPQLTELRITKSLEDRVQNLMNTERLHKLVALVRVPI